MNNSELASYREGLSERIKEAASKYTSFTGQYPNTLYLGKKEYEAWTEGYPEIYGTSEWTDENGIEQCDRYPVAHDMLVFAKAVKKDGGEYMVKSHLEVAFCASDDTKEIHENVFRTVGIRRLQ